MILDYNYNKTKKTLSISYIDENGMKDIKNENVQRFKTYQLSPTGKYVNWDGASCTTAYTESPHTFDIRTYFEEMADKYKKLIHGKTNPRLYTFDIETEISDEFPEPEEAKFPITTISIASPECNVIVLGTKELGEGGIDNLQRRLDDYLGKSKFFNGLNIARPYIKYMKFDSEGDMLSYFFKSIVAKVPILAGWNSIMFDWQYIQNRVKGYYPNVSLASCSFNETLTAKKYTDMRNNQVTLLMPNHTLIVDMMDVIGNFDMVVMPIKESLSLDYIASESIGMNKIKYDGDLQKLYNEDYSTYVFYNAIDSILVQLIDKRFKTLNNIYTQALYCKEKIGACFSKIALTQALFFNYFYEHNIKIVPVRRDEVERGTLIGAYVRVPTPGKHNFVFYNDFASLYPSTIITCNMSIENIVGTFYDERALRPYKQDKAKYIVVGGAVYENAGTIGKPKLGKFVKYCLQEDVLDKYRVNKNYFVSVNGTVYKNDKPYAFKNIQATLKANRNTGKYLAKQLEALVISDIDHLISGHTTKHQQYPENISNTLKSLGYNIECTGDLEKLDLVALKSIVKNEIEYNTSFEQAMKLLGNSMYGGSSHVGFYWFNMPLANDITGEARNIIHKMESHIPEYMAENWSKMVDFHKKHGINLKPNLRSKYISDCLSICYGDTDSLYISYNGLIDSIEGSDKLTMEKKLSIIVDLNTGFLDSHNREYMKEYYKSRHVESVQNFELETVALSGVWLDVKKRYAQILLWKDGKTYDIDNLPMKIKGLEMVKSSYPKQAREGLKRMVRYLLEIDDKDYLLQKLNMKMMEEKSKFYQADLEDICGNVGVQNYVKYIDDDADPMGLKVAPKCPYNVRALGNYNWIRNVHNLPGDPLYGGKIKWYCFYPNGVKSKKKQDPDYFAFQSRNYPKWADTYAPICKDAMFQRTMMEPFNRIIEAVGIGTLNTDGSIQMGLF
jgi:DNA polymerase elongation subunit (family B)